ncbi:MAG: ribbon-helix-helix domain-containing protein [Actinobacteria bacterium]|nr:ribbon-helix-helix domain-containing protein [Actinomycetota bacterium]
MIRTRIQLTEEQYKLLKTLSKERNVSIAEVVRECISHYYDSRCLTSEDEKCSKAIDTLGKFRSGMKDISINHDRYLAEDFKK